MQRVLGVVGGHPNDRRKDAHELRRANHCAREDDRRGQIYTRPPCASKQPRAYEWWVAQRKEARTTRRTVPQIIPVATTIAVGKLIKDPFFQPTPSIRIVGLSGFGQIRQNRRSAPNETTTLLSTPVDKLVEKALLSTPIPPPEALFCRAIRACVEPESATFINRKNPRNTVLIGLWISV
jgi:hypothetical protein